jgi:hypothetical protein
MSRAISPRSRLNDGCRQNWPPYIAIQMTGQLTTYLSESFVIRLPRQMPSRLRRVSISFGVVPVRLRVGTETVADASGSRRSV